MPLVSIPNNASVLQSLRSSLGNIKCEMQTSHPNVDKFCKKFLHTAAEGITAGLKTSVKQKMALVHLQYPKEFVKVLTRFMELEPVKEYMLKKNAFVAFEDDHIVLDTFKFSGFGSSAHDWVKANWKKLEEANIYSNACSTTTVVNYAERKKLAHLVKSGSVAKMVSKETALMCIKMYKNNEVRPTWQAQANKMYQVLGAMCVKCGDPTNRTCDHVMPRSVRMDLSTSIVNMQPLCQKCNNEKDSDYVDYRTDMQRKALIQIQFNYRIKTFSDSKALILYLEHGLTRRQIARQLKITDADVNEILSRHQPYLDKMKPYIESRRVYRRAYEELKNKATA